MPFHIFDYPYQSPFYHFDREFESSDVLRHSHIVFKEENMNPGMDVLLHGCFFGFFSLDKDREDEMLALIYLYSSKN